MTENELEWTSISVTKPVLRWVSSIKSLLEYHMKRKLTNNEAIAWICGIADHRLAKEMGLTNDEFIPFMLNRIDQFLAIDRDKEYRALLDDAKSFGLFEK